MSSDYKIAKTVGYWIVVPNCTILGVINLDGTWGTSDVWPGSFSSFELAPLEVLINTGVSKRVIERKIIPKMWYRHRFYASWRNDRKLSWLLG